MRLEHRRRPSERDVLWPLEHRPSTAQPLHARASSLAAGRQLFPPLASRAVIASCVPFTTKASITSIAASAELSKSTTKRGRSRRRGRRRTGRRRAALRASAHAAAHHLRQRAERLRVFAEGLDGG